MTPAEIIRADYVLATVIETDPHLQFLASRIRLRFIQDIQRHAGLATTAETELTH